MCVILTRVRMAELALKLAIHMNALVCKDIQEQTVTQVKKINSYDTL